jgi:hypothetical protein
MAVGTQKTGSLAELKAIASPTVNDIFYLRDVGKEGEFAWDTTILPASVPAGDARLDATIIKHNTVTAGVFRRIFEDGMADVKWYGAVGNGTTNDSAAIQKAVNASDIVTVIFDNNKATDFLVNTNITVPPGKVLKFRKGNRLTGTAIITGGIIDAPLDANIFATTLTVNPEGVSNSYLSAKWFGALGNGIADDYDSLQKAIDTGISGSVRKVYIPFGTYKIRKGLLLRKGTDQFLDGFELTGEVTAYGGGIGQSKIILDSVSSTTKNSFGIGLHKCKGVRVKNIYLEGRNTNLGTFSLYDVFENPATNWTNGCSNATTSPHAGFIVDPFVNDPAHLAKYPDFTDKYVTEGSGGSTDIVFENCRVKFFVVGICFSPHTIPQNGEAMAVNNCWVDYCKSAISVGQSQNRSIYVNNLKCWGATETVLDSVNYSDGTADNVEVDGLQLAGAIKFLCRIGNWFTKGLIIRRMHAESLYSLGGNFGSNIGDLVIENSWVNFQPVIRGVNPVHNAISFFKGASLKIVDSYLGKYSATDNMPLQFDATQVVFEKTTLNWLCINTNITGKVLYKNCLGAGSNYPYGDGEIFSGFKPAEITGTGPLFLSNMEWQVAGRVNLFLPKGATQSHKRIRVPRTVQDQGYYFSKELYLVPLNLSKVITNIDSSQLTADISFVPASEEFKLLRVGDFIYTSSANLSDEYGQANKFLLLGKITAKNNITGLVSLGLTAKGINSTETYLLFVYRNEFLIPPLILGDISSGSNVISNCVSEQFVIISQVPVGVTINSPYFPLGTHIVSATNTSVTLSNNANATRNGIEVISADWTAIEYGSVVIGNTLNFGYKKGDTVFNTDMVNYPDIEKWICTKSGITNTSRLPEFDIVFKNSDIIFTADGSFSVSGGRYLNTLIVNPAANLTAFKIGTVAGGNDVVNITAVTGNSDKVISVGRYFRNGTTLYVSGITASTQLILLK